MTVTNRDIWSLVDKELQDQEPADVQAAVNDLKATITGAGFGAIKTAITGKFTDLTKTNQLTVLQAIIKGLGDQDDATLLDTVDDDWPAAMQALDARSKMNLLNRVLNLYQRRGLDEVPD